MFGFKLVKNQEIQSLREEMSVYKRQLEDLSWINLSIDPVRSQGSAFNGQLEFEKMIVNCRILFYKNPLVGQWCNLVTNFVFGEGVSTPTSNDKLIQEHITSFWEDKDNQVSLTSFQAQDSLSKKIVYEGNLFFLLFDDDAGNVRVRVLNTIEVADVIYDPQDRSRPIFYKVKANRTQYNFGSDSYSVVSNGFVYYSAHDNYDPLSYNIPANKLIDGVRVIHFKINCDINDRFGIPEIYRATDWLQAHKGMAEDLATLIKALSQYAWKKKVRGTATQISTIAANIVSKTNLSNIKNSSGQMQVENEGVDLQSIDIKTGGVKVGTDGLRQMKLQVCSASGIFEHYWGDPSTGNLATAKSMELPMVKKFSAYQTFWTNVYLQIINYMIDRKIEAGVIPGQVIDDAKLRRRSYIYSGDRNIDIDFPPILEQDLKESADALSLAKDKSLITDDLAAELFMLSANINNIDEELELLKSERELKKSDELEMLKKQTAKQNINNPDEDNPIKESIDLPSKRIELRSKKKEAFVLQKMNGYRKSVSGHFKTLLKEIRDAVKVSGTDGRFVGHVPGYQEIVHKFLNGMRESARAYYPIAVDIGEKFMQATLKDVKPEVKIHETLYEASGKAKGILADRLKWNDYFLYDKLEPDLIVAVEKIIKQAYNSSDEFTEAVYNKIKSFEPRMEMYVGAFWTVEQEAVKEAGRGTGVMVNFVGPDDDHNCDGCNAAVNGGPYLIDQAPLPGEQECLGRCRHALQIVTE